MKAIRLTARRALLSVGCGAALLVGVPFTAHARTDVSVHIDIGNAPPAPYYRFYEAPREVYVEDRVYLVEAPVFGDADCFHYGGYYWVFRDGYWYRAPSLRSRFVVISPRYVPAVIYDVPARDWKHHPYGPPSRVRYADHPGRGGGPSYHEGGRGRGNHGGEGHGDHGGGHGGGHGNGDHGHGNGDHGGNGHGHGGHGE
jgi:hypothetical protein